MDEWIFLSYLLDGRTPAYGGGESIQIESVRSMENGDTCNTSQWALSNHLGTHIDAPRHFAHNGKTVDDYPASFWIFTSVCVVCVETTKGEMTIGRGELEKAGVPDQTDLLIFKTGFSDLRDKDSYIYEGPVFLPETADYIRSELRSVRVIGFDSISVSSWRDRPLGRETHKRFLDHENPILLLEDLDLSSIDRHSTIVCCIISPLRVTGADASPCTVLARIHHT
ncbi:MAG: cyclase family protein [Deltaproteobacteria bacterium]|nr:cyclase family protein [Candidatus Zymogenaceae bacterium]